MTIWILRASFMVFVVGVGAALAINLEMTSGERILTFVLFMLGGSALIVGDTLIKIKRIDLISSVYFGLLVGLFLTFIFSLALESVFAGLTVENSGFSKETTKSVVITFLAVALCYICISLLWQTKDDFRFIIPYVEFSREVKGSKPYILDTSVVIDGRIADIIETGIFDNQLIMPRFVLGELQAIADSSDKIRRAPGTKRTRCPE